MAFPEKILFVIDHFRNPYAGTEGQLFQLVSHLDRGLFEPHLLVLKDSDYLQSGGFPCGHTVLGSQRLAAPVTWLRLLILGRAFRRQGFRLAHVFFNDASIICPPVFSFLGIRTIISRRDMGYWYTPRLLRVLRVTGKFVTAVAANSHAVAGLTQQKEGIPPERINVIYNGVVDGNLKNCIPVPELEVFQEKDQFVVMLVANIRPIKRIEDSIKALASLGSTANHVRLVIVGGGDPGPLLTLAQELGVEHRIRFLGARDDVWNCLRYADVGLLCSESEGFSNSIVEYMLQEIPVVCTNTGGNPEAITHGITGFLYPVGEVGQLTRLLKRLADNPWSAKEMGSKAATEAKERFSVGAMVKNYHAFYGELLSWDR